MIVASIFTVLIQRNTMPTSGISCFITRSFHRAITNTLGITVQATGVPNTDSTLFISNHITWLDILIIGQIIPAHFLAMIEVKSWPIVGWLATRAGTLYISRGNKIAATTAIEDVGQILKSKHNVIIFAEGRVTDGNIRKFHSRLFQSAIDSRSQIQPIALRYPSADGSLVNPTVLFTENTTLPQSLYKIITTKRTEVEISFLQPIDASNQTRNQLAFETEQLIRQHLGQVKKSNGLITQA